LDGAAIRRANLTVAIDVAKRRRLRFLEPFAQRLGFRLVAVKCRGVGLHWPATPSRAPATRARWPPIMPLVHAHAGFVTSSDLGRVSLVAEDGETASEEYTFPLVADHVLARTPGPVVSNCCTTRIVDDVARAHGCRIVKSAVGQAYVMAALTDEQGAIGGEGNGSVAVPRFSRAFDGLLTIGLVLEDLAQRGGTLSGRCANCRAITSPNGRCTAIRASAIAPSKAWNAIRTGPPRPRLDHTDGLRADWEDGLGPRARLAHGADAAHYLRIAPAPASRGPGRRFSRAGWSGNCEGVPQSRHLGRARRGRRDLHAATRGLVRARLRRVRGPRQCRGRPRHAPDGDMLRTGRHRRACKASLPAPPGGCSSPRQTVGILVRDLAARGGITITASHNPAPWNALKFMGRDGLFLDRTRAEELLRYLPPGPVRPGPRGGASPIAETITDPTAPISGV